MVKHRNFHKATFNPKIGAAKDYGCQKIWLLRMLVVENLESQKFRFQTLGCERLGSKEIRTYLGRWKGWEYQNFDVENIGW